MGDFRPFLYLGGLFNLSRLLSGLRIGYNRRSSRRDAGKLRRPIGELLSEVVTRIEPGAKGPGLAGWRFPESKLRLAGRLKPVIRNGENGGDDVRLVSVKNLYDVTVRLRISQLENILARLQYFVRNLNRLVDSQYSFLVPRVRSRGRGKSDDQERGTRN